MSTSSGESTDSDESTEPFHFPPVFGSVPTRPVCAVIDLDALRSNYRQLQAIAAPARVIAVIKADAYGHGAIPVARALLANAEPANTEPSAVELDTSAPLPFRESVADSSLQQLSEYQPPALFGVATVDEGLALRHAGITTPILLLSAILPAAAPMVVEGDLTATVFTLELATALNEAAREQGKVAPVHFKIDTGLRRLGVWHEEAAATYRAIRDMPYLAVEGFYTHLACADHASPAMTQRQLAALRRTLKECGHDPDRRSPQNIAIHAANSAATLRHPEAHFDLVRPGLSLYGCYPGAHSRHDDVRLQPVMNLLARVTDVRDIVAGDTVSYGATWQAERPSRIAVVPVGYADGYPRLLSNRASVAINGRRCPVIGRVTMDQIMVDCTELGLNVQPGSDVTLWGRGPGGEIPLDELAELAETISYELLCGVAKRVPRVYMSGGALLEDLPHKETLSVETHNPTYATA